MPEFYPNQSNSPDFPVQPQDEGYFTKLESVPDLRPAESGLLADSKAEQQQAYAEMILRVITLDDKGNFEEAKRLREEADNFRDEHGLQQVDVGHLIGPDGTAAPDIDKHAA